MNARLDHPVIEPNQIPNMELSGMPEAFQRAYGPTVPFENDFGDLSVPDVTPIPYQGNRKINPVQKVLVASFARNV